MQVWGMLVEMRLDTVSGFDLTALNAFRWHPHHEKVDLSRQGIWSSGFQTAYCQLSAHPPVVLGAAVNTYVDAQSRLESMFCVVE